MADIQLDSITNTAGTGVFDKLMNAVNTNIESQYLQSRITGSDFANVYLGSIQAVLQQSIQYVISEQLTEAQIDSIVADNLVKAKQLEIAQQELLAKTFEVTNILPEQLVKLQEEVALLRSQDLVAYTDRVIKDKQAAKLGLDNVMKQAEATKLSNPSAVYTPKYEAP